jgi:phosphoribosylamine--glycine ligase
MPGAAVGIVLAAAGYPDSPRRGDRIDGRDDLAHDVLVFHSGTRRGPDGVWQTNGGRVLTVVARGADLDAAGSAAERAAGALRFDGVQRRHDIAAVPVGSVA